MDWIKKNWKLLAIALAVVVAAVVLIVVLTGGNSGDKDTDTITSDNPATTDSETLAATAAPKATTPPEQFEYSTNDDGTIAIIGYNGDAKELVIPSDIEGTAVTRIGYGALQYCKNITSIVVPEGVKTINSKAFAGIETLKDVWLPASLESCDWDSFCVWEDTTWAIPYWLTYHVLPNTYAQRYCTDELMIAEVKTGNASEYLNYRGEFGYYWYTDDSVKVYYGGASADVTIPSSINGYPVKAIPENSFNSQGVKHVTIPEGVETIEWCAFKKCLDLESITIPSSVTSIDQYALPYWIYDEDMNIANIEEKRAAFTLIVNHGSYAEQYCKEYNINMTYAD